VEGKSVNDTGRVVAIGCSGCGALAALTLKKLAPAMDVTIIREQEEKGLLTRCATPYICCGHVMVDPSYKSDSIFTDLGIRLVNVKAVEINRGAKTVATADGNTYSYDKLVLATGAKPFVPPLPGTDLPGVFTLRTSGDAVEILHWLNSRRVSNAVLVGAGAIGIEEAYLLSNQGVRVTVVEMLDHVMPKVLDADMSRGVEGYMREKGVDLKLSRQVSRILGSESVETVELDSDEQIEAGMVIVSAGARPNLEMADEAGLQHGELGLKVNKYLQTSDPDIYAGGDLIQYEDHVTGKPTLGQLRPNAVIAGRTIARNMLGQEVEFPPFINAFSTKFFDKSIAGAGVTEATARAHDLDVVSSRSESASQHSMMRDRRPYVLKLIFRRDNQQIVGGQIVSDSECPARYIDALALAIRARMSALDLSTFRAAGQPELSPDPGKEPIAVAAQNAWLELHQEASAVSAS
jgi:NADPH-dependent 2,4-dienoyl-CoA reductase/sulfur reductase-like enzyme